MSIFFYKSILSLFMIVFAVVAMYTMFEIFGRSQIKNDVAKLKKVHRINGISYFVLFIFLTYFCIDFIVSAKVELSSRAAFHSIFSLTIILLISIKISFIRIYKKFYVKAQTIGLLIALITFGMVGTSGIYYLLVSELGAHKTYDTFLESKKESTTSELKVKKERRGIIVRTDSESIKRGKNIIEKSCAFCHDPYSERVIMGPGLKGVLQNTLLPATKNEATPENIRKQLKNPFKQMPSFAHLQEDEVSDIISFLNTL